LIVHHSEPARVTLAVVSLGATAHLQVCLAAIVAHESKSAFRVVWVNNSVGALSPPTAISVPVEVLEIDLDTNLGWAGGLHQARESSDAEFLVWVQEDMEVREGWLDALVAAADEHPEFAAFGSLAMMRENHPAGFAGGRAFPYDDVRSWNLTDTTAESVPTAVTGFDWITSKGLLTRVSAWDLIGGTDPRLFPLNHVDKDYCTHLRAHGLAVALVPSARLFHIGGASSPSTFRLFVAAWQEPRFNAQWGAIVKAMDTNPGPTDHECNAWRPGPWAPDTVLEHVRRAVGDEAARMLVPFARWINLIKTREEQERVMTLVDQETSLIEQRFRSSTSWRVTAPLRAVLRFLSPARRPNQRESD
jgi:GT2 family glycosyltransferase